MELSSLARLVSRWLRLPWRSPAPPAPARPRKPLSTPPPHPPAPGAPAPSEADAWERLWEARLLLWGVGKRSEAESAVSSMLDEPLDNPSWLVERSSERKLISALLIGRRREILSKFAQRVSRRRLSDLLESKVPPLKAWAMSALSEEDILPAADPSGSMLDWARREGFLSFGAMRESHLAEALRVGSRDEAVRALSNGGLSRVPARMAAILLDAFAIRQAADGGGLGPDGVSIFWDLSGGERLLDRLAALGPDAPEEIARLAISASASPPAIAEMLNRAKRCKSRALREALESKASARLRSPESGAPESSRQSPG